MSTFKIEPAIWCVCDEKIKAGEVAYGRTPYIIQCPNCNLSLYDIMPSGVGWHLGEDHAIEAFRDYCEAHSILKGKAENGGYSSRITDLQIREQMYRTAKGWGSNP